VTHPRIVTADEQVNSSVAGRTTRRISLTASAGRRGN